MESTSISPPIYFIHVWVLRVNMHTHSYTPHMHRLSQISFVQLSPCRIHAHTYCLYVLGWESLPTGCYFSISGVESAHTVTHTHTYTHTYSACHTHMHTYTIPLASSFKFSCITFQFVQLTQCKVPRPTATNYYFSISGVVSLIHTLHAVSVSACVYITGHSSSPLYSNISSFV